MQFEKIRLCPTKGMTTKSIYIIIWTVGFVPRYQTIPFILNGYDLIHTKLNHSSIVFLNNAQFFSFWLFSIQFCWKAIPLLYQKWPPQRHQLIIKVFFCKTIYSFHKTGHRKIEQTNHAQNKSYFICSFNLV